MIAVGFHQTKITSPRTHQKQGFNRAANALRDEVDKPRRGHPRYHRLRIPKDAEPDNNKENVKPLHQYGNIAVAVCLLDASIWGKKSFISF